MIDLAADRVRRNPVEPALLARVLAPYKPHCRYLQRAVWETAEPGADHAVRLSGELGIPASCYIDDTGHFNSVEFNICYNQLMYVLMAQCVVSRLMPPFARMSYEEFLQRQLPDVLIHDFHSKFPRPIDPLRFRGAIEFVDASERRGMILVHTRCTFEDDRGGRCHGEVTLAVVERDGSAPERA
ncbi:MAG TPA: FcoT family thioesterase [Planctomycetota bacterium]|nr:FcoT family thioesterase [Planctomycetota bacterium]